MTLFSEIIQYTISGLSSGSIYAIVGICWSTVFLISGVMNFATGEFVMLGGMLTCVFYEAGISLPLAIFLSIMVTITVAALLERIVIRPIRQPTEMTYMLITIAAASVIKGVILISFGSETRTLPPFINIAPVNIFGATIIPQTIVIISVLGITTVGLLWFFNCTLFGKALRASSINQIGAGLIGVDINKIRFFCFGLAGALGALAGIVITPVAFTGYSIGLMTALKGLVVAIVGGWNIGGTVAAGLILGLLEGFVAGFISTGWKDALALTLMVFFLLFQTIDISWWKRKIYR